MGADLKTIQADATTMLDAIVQKASSFQEDYRKANFRYAQCVQTPDIVPEDGATKATDLTTKPDYQVEDWQSLGFTLPATTDYSLRIDVYDGPKGQDWCAVAIVAFAGVRYAKTQAAHGNEAPTFDWTVTGKAPSAVTVTPSGLVDAIEQP